MFCYRLVAIRSLYDDGYDIPPIKDLTTKIEEYTAASARLNTEIKNLEKEVAANQEALDKATAIREKQLAEFNAEEKDLLQS